MAAGLVHNVSQAAEMLRRIPQKIGRITTGAVFEDDRPLWWGQIVHHDATKHDFHTLGVQVAARAKETRTCISRVDDALDYIKSGEFETKKNTPSGVLFELPKHKLRPTAIAKGVKVRTARVMRWEQLHPISRGHSSLYEYPKCVKPMMTPTRCNKRAEYYLRRCIQVIFELYVATVEDETISAINCDLNSTSQCLFVYRCLYDSFSLGNVGGFLAPEVLGAMIDHLRADAVGYVE